MTSHIQHKAWEEEFDKSFPGLKSVGHKMIHKDNHNAHDGSSCSSECKYVGQSIKSFIKRLISTREKEIAEEVKELPWLHNDSGVKELEENVDYVEVDKVLKILKH